jgi:hypothetical protein
LIFRNGELKNPSAITGSDGNFIINVDLNLFEKTVEFTVLARSDQFNSKFSKLRNTAGDVLKFRITGKSKSIDLGKAILK